MAKKDGLLDEQARSAIQKLAKEESLDGQRAQALLRVDEGMTQADAGDAVGLTAGQVGYIVRKYRKQGLDAFEGRAESQPSAAKTAVKKEDTGLNDLISDLDSLVNDLKKTFPDGSNSPYTPLNLLQTVRQNVTNLAPDVQKSIQEALQGVTADDLKDIETWKGLAFMMSHSARFQAGQLKERLNEQMPDPMKPDTIYTFFKQNLDKVTPELAKDLYQNLQGTTREDLKDPDTWKGMWYMINYSVQFQVDQLKQRVAGQKGEDESAA